VKRLKQLKNLRKARQRRTTVSVSGLGLDTIGNFICSFIGGGVPENPRQDISLAYTLNLATDDIKAYYCEGITTQPGQESPSSKVLSGWFWGETMAERVLLAIKDVCMKSEDGLMRIVGKMLIVPTAQAHRSKLPHLKFK